MYISVYAIYLVSACTCTYNYVISTKEGGRPKERHPLIPIGKHCGLHTVMVFTPTSVTCVHVSSGHNAHQP